jgi:hypothetical protein
MVNFLSKAFISTVSISFCNNFSERSACPSSSGCTKSDCAMYDRGNKLRYLRTNAALACQRARPYQHKTPSPSNEKPEPEPQPQTMPDESFSKFLQALRRETFDDEKLEFLAPVAHQSYFSSEQVRQILDKFLFDNNREEAAIILYPKVVDPVNWFVIYDTFTFSSNVNEIRDWLCF